MSGGGGSQYSGTSNNQGYGMGYQPQSMNPQFRGAMGYGANRAAQMPNPGRYPNPYNGPQYPSGGPDQVVQSIGSPASVFGKGGQPTYSSGQPEAISDPASVFGKGTPPQFTSPDGYAPAISDPASVFGKGVPPDVSQTFQTRPMETGGMSPAPQAPQPQNTAAQMNAFSNSIASFQNPYGFSQQQLGPSFNPVGSPQGGFFNGNNYVANVGNARNGLDRMSRLGLNWNGQPFGKIGA